MNDPMTILKRDHREARAMLVELKESKPGSQRQRQLGQLERALLLHMQIEEALLYPLLEQYRMSEQATEAETEHQLVRDGLNQARDFVGEPGFGAIVDMLLAGVMHHVREEESEILPRLKEAVPRDEWKQLGEQIVAVKLRGGEPSASKERATSANGSGRPPSKVGSGIRR